MDRAIDAVVEKYGKKFQGGKDPWMNCADILSQNTMYNVTGLQIA
jgi:hypothetical protein